MRSVLPKLSNTAHSPDFREWRPSSFEAFLPELDHIIDSCEGEDPLPLFRGQSDSSWFLDSKFLRFSIQNIFKLPNHYKLPEKIRQDIRFHKVITHLFFLKFGVIGNPSQEAIEAEMVHDIDPWFEWLKNLQQYPENDCIIPGTFFLDWTFSKDIALYFATYVVKGRSFTVHSGDGALWIFDAASTGKILQTKKLGEILKMMDCDEFFNGKKTFPLLFHPKNQILQAKNQDPIYIAQMDFRYDLAAIWADYENRQEKKVYVKLILPGEAKLEALNYLKARNIDENYVFQSDTFKNSPGSN